MTSNNDSPKKKKKIQKLNSMYEVNREVTTVNWYRTMFFFDSVEALRTCFVVKLEASQPEE